MHRTLFRIPARSAGLALSLLVLAGVGSAPSFASLSSPQPILTAPASPPPPDDAETASLLAQYPLLQGLDPRARGPLLSVVHPARVTATLEDFTESAGTHRPEPGSLYTAAVDLYIDDLTPPQIEMLLDQLGDAGFVAWYRNPGKDGWPGSGMPHIHALFAGIPLKSSLRAQVKDYLKGRNGLKGHQKYQFHRFEPGTMEAIRQSFERRSSPPLLTRALKIGSKLSLRLAPVAGEHSSLTRPAPLT